MWWSSQQMTTTTVACDFEINVFSYSHWTIPLLPYRLKSFVVYMCQDSWLHFVSSTKTVCLYNEPSCRDRMSDALCKRHYTCKLLYVIKWRVFPMIALLHFTEIQFELCRQTYPARFTYSQSFICEQYKVLVYFTAYGRRTSVSRKQLFFIEQYGIFTGKMNFVVRMTCVSTI